VKIRFAGFGGQGIVLCGVIFGRAAMLDGKNSMQTQSYGSASRGGLTRSDVCIQSDEIHDLIYDEFDVLVTMSQPSYGAFRELRAPGGRLFYDADLVKLSAGDEESAFGVRATEIAYGEFNLKIIANMVMMGFANRISEMVSQVSLVQTVRESVPAGTEDKNAAAIAEGVRQAERILEKVK
jgi:2-oxoglutarate ferredoxin oxidoreductase subunit gamma